MASVGTLRPSGLRRRLTMALGPHLHPSSLFRNRTMSEGIDHRGYLLAPLVPPTLNIAFVPVWSILAGHAESAGAAMAWQLVAWFGLEAACLASIYPLLWLLHKQIISLPVSTRVAAALSFFFSACASFALFGPIQVQGHVFASWGFAFIAAALAFSAFQSRQSRRLQQAS